MTALGDRVKVLYISGHERSGSTILTKVLGEIDGAFAVGEIRSIWRYSYIDNGPCGCGRPFHDCETWQAIFRDAFDAEDAVDPHWMAGHRPRMKHAPLMFVPGGKRIFSRQFRDYIDTLDRLYVAAARSTGSRLIVDSSKTLVYGYVLGLLPSVDRYVVHLVRDPRGVQYSHLRRKQQGDPRFQHHSVARNSLMWDALNVTQELTGIQERDRYLRLRYEEFAHDPRGTLERIASFVGEPNVRLPNVDGRQIQLSTHHTINGSPHRFDTGAVSLRPDDRWEADMAPRDRDLVARLTLPLRYRYGYR